MPTAQRRLVPVRRVSTLALLTLGLLMPIGTPAAAQSADAGSIFVRGYAGLIRSSADNGDTSQTAALVGGGLGWNLTRHLALIGDAGYITNVATSEGLDVVNRIAALITLVSGVGADVSLEARTLYVLGGGRFTFGEGRLRPFVEGQGGIARTSFSLQISSSAGSIVVSDATTIFKGLIGNTAPTVPAAAGGGGIDWRLSRHADAEASYHFMRLFGDAQANVQQITAGLRFNF